MSSQQPNEKIEDGYIHTVGIPPPQKKEKKEKKISKFHGLEGLFVKTFLLSRCYVRRIDY